MNVEQLPLLDMVFGRQFPRLRGISSWEPVAVLGKGNLERFVQLAQEKVHFLLAEGSSRDELRSVRDAILYLTGRLAVVPPVKPLLPRLRAENFRKGDTVLIYVGDSPGAIAPRPWVPATITSVVKSYRAEWADGLPGTLNTGYYWRLTATASVPIFPDACQVVFSTSEPRILPAGDFAFLTAALDSEERFVDIYCANAWRDWQPLWCLERGIPMGDAMDMKLWLRHADLSA